MSDMELPEGARQQVNDLADLLSERMGYTVESCRDALWRAINAHAVPEPEPPSLAERIEGLLDLSPVRGEHYRSEMQVGEWEWIARARDLLREAVDVDLGAARPDPSFQEETL